MKLKQIFTNWRVIMLLVFLIFSVVAIKPQLFGNEGVTIRSVAVKSSAAIAGIENPSSTLTPLAKEKIISINGDKVASLDDYYALTSALEINRTARIETDRSIYSVLTKKGVDGSLDLGLNVYPAPTTNLRKGLDLEGGTRVLMRPVEEVSDDVLEITIANLKERLNVY